MAQPGHLHGGPGQRADATLITELEFNRLVVDKLLNHKDQMVGGVYDRHSYDKEKRQALEAWERDLEARLFGQSQGAEVVELVAEERCRGRLRYRERTASSDPPRFHEENPEDPQTGH